MIAGPHPLPRRPARLSAVVVGAVLVVALGLLAVVPVAAQETTPTVGKAVRAGDATVVDGNNSSKSLTGGGSTTPFTFRLPDGAACPGDSAHHNWRIQSFIIPAADDPGSLTYRSISPQGAGHYPLNALDTTPFSQRLTAVADPPDGPGLIDHVDSFDFKVIPPGTFPNGTYKIGLACTLLNQTAEYWDTEITITNTSADKPAGFTWAVVGASSSSSSSSSSTGLVLAGLLVALGVVVGVVFFVRSRREERPAAVPHQEER